MNRAQLEYIREALEARREELALAAAAVRPALALGAGVERTIEEEEAAQAEHYRFTALALNEGQRRAMALIEGALARMRMGTYGVCEECGERVDARRLRALPTAPFCAGCATRLERPRRGA